MAIFFQERYNPLRATSEGDEDEALGEEVVGHSTDIGRHVWLALAICLLCTVLNILVLADLGFPKTGRADKWTSLPRPNKYIGLETVDRSNTSYQPPAPIFNFPQLLTQVDKTRPLYTFPDDSRRWYSWTGTVSPDDRRFHVNKYMNSIAQFRIIDWGMEECAVVIHIPSKTPLRSSGTNTTVSLGSNETSIDVWLLHSDSPIDPRTLSWKTRPRRERRLATLHILAGEVSSSERFLCRSDSLQTLEYACSMGYDCMVDLWQDKEEPLLGTYMRQYPTV